MFINTQLPAKENYIQIPIPESDSKIIWVDKSSHFFRVIGEDDPFDASYLFSVQTRWGRSDKSKYLNGIDFKKVTKKRGDGQPVQLVREIYKSISAYKMDEALSFWAVPIGLNIWLQYSVIKK